MERMSEDFIVGLVIGNKYGNSSIGSMIVVG